MRALLLIHNVPERGSYFRALEIAKRLAARGHYVELTVVSPMRRFRATFAPIKSEVPGSGKLLLVESPSKTWFTERQEGWSLFDVGFRVKHALGSQWDLVYGFSHKPDCVLPGLAGRLRGAKFVLDWSDWWGTPEGLYKTCVLPSDYFQSLPAPLRIIRRAIFGIEDFLEPRVYAWPNTVTLISEEYLRHPRAPRGLAQKALVMHSGAPLQTIVPMPAAEARKACGLEFPPGAIVLGYLANFHTDERLLLEAFAAVCGHRKDVYLLAVGSDFERSDPGLHESIKDRVRHVGRKLFEQVGPHLCAADILLLPLSDVALNRARYPHKLSDYVAAGRPIVGCDVGESGRLMRRFGFGHLTQPSASCFCSGIMEVLDSPAQWAEMGRQTRRAAEEHFDWDSMCETLFAFIGERTGLRL